MRRQFVLDKRTDKLLKKLASYHDGNCSLVVRQAIQLYADVADHLDRVESDPAFQKMMDDSNDAIRKGRVTPHSEVVRMSRALSIKRRSRRIP
jgi:predicted transcriptional regulator